MTETQRPEPFPLGVLYRVLQILYHIDQCQKPKIFSHGSPGSMGHHAGNLEKYDIKYINCL